MTYNLGNKAVLITGGNSGIGKAAAIQLAEAGANVVIGCRSLERGKKAVEDIQTASKNMKVGMLEIDLSSQKSIRQAAETFLSNHTRLDVLIHNAANFDHALKKPKLTEDEWRPFLRQIM